MYIRETVCSDYQGHASQLPRRRHGGKLYLAFRAPRCSHSSAAVISRWRPKPRTEKAQTASTLSSVDGLKRFAGSPLMYHQEGAKASWVAGEQPQQVSFKG